MRTPEEVAQVAATTVHGKCVRCVSQEWCDEHESLWPSHQDSCFTFMSWLSVARMAVVLDRDGIPTEEEDG